MRRRYFTWSMKDNEAADVFARVDERGGVTLDVEKPSGDLKGLKPRPAEDLKRGQEN